MRYPHIPDISVGNRILDSEYKKMFDTIHQIQCSIRAKNPVAVASDFKLLEDIACACFAVEEKIAQAVGVDFALHSLAHQNLLKKYRQVRDELAAKNGSWSDNDGEMCAKTLNDCLMRHLEYESESLRIVLDTYLYDFNPTQETDSSL